MDKIKVDAGGYTLNGKLITPMNIKDLTDDEIRQLSETHASAWEILKIRASNHELINAINRVFSSCAMNCESALNSSIEISKQLKTIQDSLLVTQINGTIKKRPVSEVVAELLELHKPDRKRKALLEAVAQYKRLIYLLLLTIIGVSFFFHAAINQLLQSIQGWIFVLIPASGIFTLILKYGFEKLFKVKDSN